MGKCSYARLPWSLVRGVDVKCRDYLEMFQIERVNGLPYADGDGSNEAIQDANAMDQAKLLQPLAGSFRIARLEVQHGVSR